LTAAPDQQLERVPTVLIAAHQELLNVLVHLLELDGYLVFEARNQAEALHVVVSQSRLIHILLADVNMNGYALARTLKPYRPEMKTLFVTAHPQQGLSDALIPSVARARVRELLKVPTGMAAERRLIAGAA